MSDLFKYLRNPLFITAAESPFSGKIKCFLWACLFCELAVLATIFVLGIINAVVWLLYETNLVSEIFSNKKAIKTWIFPPALYIILIGPFIEEVVFRLFLNLRKLTISISLSVYIYLISANWIGTKHIELNVCLRIILVIVVTILVYRGISERFLILMKTKYFRYIFYSAAILFGFVHLFNFSPLSMKVILVSPLLILPPVCYGLAMGYLRLKLKNGFIWGLALHIFINGTTQLFLLIG